MADYSEYVRTTLSTITEHGTDRYGIIHSPVWVLALDTNSLDAIRWMRDPTEQTRHWRLAQGERMYSTYVPYGFGYRNIRVSQRPGGCSNLFIDQPLIRAARLDDTLGGQERWKPHVAEYVRYYMEHFVDPQTGLLEWGVHTSWNVFEECVDAKDGHWHELQALMVVWPLLHEICPKITHEQMELFWQWHTDPETGEVGRHPEKGAGCNFAMAAGEMVLTCAYMHTLHPDGPWLDRALTIARCHWSYRNEETNLFPNQFPTERLRDRFDAQASDTSVPGLWASRVLAAGLMTGCDELVRMARAVLRAWAEYGWDDENQAPWAMLLPDGSPVTGEREQSQNYDKFAPKGHWNYWEDYIYGFEYPFKTLLSFAWAARVLDDDLLTDHSRRLADCYIQKLPPNDGMGTFAANYGQLISFLRMTGERTGDATYADTARSLADEAVEKLWTGEIFRGFPGRDQYHSADGVGYLLQALVELDTDGDTIKDLIDESPFWLNI